ncbi:MAG: alkaline phosphatase family protein [Kofleriaceae bacterium]
MRRLMTAILFVITLFVAIRCGLRARDWNDQLGLVSPYAQVEPIVTDPHTPRLTDRVVLITIDGLGIDESHLPFLDELRARGIAAIAAVPYPTISRPNYVTILSGVPPEDSGVRANRVRIPVAVDSVMDRVQAAHLRVATTGDFGMMPSLFARHTRSLSDIGWIAQGTRITPPAPITWPVDEARRAPSLAALAPIIADFAARDFAFVPVLVLDVDRAGHAEGVGETYRATAIAVDRMLRAALAAVDLSTTTVIVTADHGHVAPGGHGGTEREVAHVPLILVGKGVVAGAQLEDPRLIDVAPTVAALLGLPAPGHAEGRALVEALSLTPEERERRTAIDATRVAELATVIAEAHAVERPVALHLMYVLVLLIVFVVMTRASTHAFVIDRRAPVAWIAFGVMLVAIGAVTRWQFSPSYVPSLALTLKLCAIGIAIAVALQVTASWFVIRRAPDRLLAANGLAAAGLAGSLTVLYLVRTWFHMPFVIVPSPFWIVAVPTIELATAACAIACAITLVGGAVISSRTGSPPARSP